MRKYSVLLEIEIQAETHDELNETVEKISSECTNLLDRDVKPYGYYKYPSNSVQTTLD